MSDYGLRVLNDYGSLTISSDNRVLVYSQRGTVNITSPFIDRQGYGYITFSKVVTTQEPPHVYVRVASANAASISTYVSLNGSAGNWTGCHVYTGGGTVVQNHTFEYVVCQMVSERATSDFGIEVFDGNGNITYQSDNRVVRYNKFTKNWTVVNSNSIYVYSCDITIDNDDFIPLTWINRGLNWNTGSQQYVSLSIRSGSAPTLKILWQYVTDGVWYNDLMSGDTKFSIPVCKFPISKYYG